jgi:hypothetical protein
MEHRAVSRMLSTAALGGLVLAGMLVPAASHAATLPVRPQSFTVVSVPNATPNTLVVQRSVTGPEITVTLSPAATIVRRFDGKSNLGEFSGGDHVLITPVAPPIATGAATSAPTEAITAGAVKDESIQVGYTQINGRVVFVDQALNQLVLIVTADEGKLAAIPVGDHAFVDVTPTTPVSLVGKSNATMADVRPGMVLTMWGLTQNEAHVLFAPRGITQLLGNAATLTQVAPNDSTPE